MGSMGGQPKDHKNPSYDVDMDGIVDASQLPAVDGLNEGSMSSGDFLKFDGTSLVGGTVQTQTPDGVSIVKDSNSDLSSRTTITSDNIGNLTSRVFSTLGNTTGNLIDVTCNSGEVIVLTGMRAGGVDGIDITVDGTTVSISDYINPNDVGGDGLRMVEVLNHLSIVAENSLKIDVTSIYTYSGSGPDIFASYMVVSK